MKLWKALLRLFLLLVVVLVGSHLTCREVLGQTDFTGLLEVMTPEEKVGQLFLVTFDGVDVGEESEIYDLITNYDIGGVILQAENQNFAAENTLEQTMQMIQTLQELAWQSSSLVTSGEITGDDTVEPFIPLYIGLNRVGDSEPGNPMLAGLSTLPSQMAIGATWDINQADQVGQVLGATLRQIGFNLYLGPSLDVLETADNTAAEELGADAFGGNPYWVGEIGRAFINGVHVGSDNRVMVVAQNFPGTGNSDRSTGFEVATVQKSLEQLKQVELVPYFSVTTPEISDSGRVDAVMVSHIRYQGFQGTIRSTTRPISFDSNALQQIIDLPQFASWREDGGVLISDNLGSGGVRRFFDPNETNFDAKAVARNAFLAGNDILYIDGMVATGDPDEYTTLISTIDFLVQKYREDSAFAKRVDTSVQRILAAKMRLYESFSLSNVNTHQLTNEILDQSQDVTSEVAQNGVTLISPSAQELDAILPSAPLWYEGMVIFTDVRRTQLCSDCPLFNNIENNDLANALIRLYGPDVGGQILENRLSSYTFGQLTDLLDNVEDTTTEFLPENLSEADWVIFNCLDVDPDYPDSNALQRILTERQDLLAGKNVIVFALNSPTYLDATDIAKITAYYALYSKAPAAFDVAARVLMKELDPPGALPISLDAVGYDLAQATSPHPDQVISLSLVLPEEEELEEETPVPTPETTQTPAPTPLPRFNIGDTLSIQTGQIYDHNQNIVPDGTVVQFNFRITGEPDITQQFETTTTSGIAYFNYRVEAAGSLEVSATSEPANQSEILLINISSEGITSILAYTPTPLNSPTPTITLTPTVTQTPSPTSTPAPVDRNTYPTLGQWAYGVIVLALGSVVTYLIGYFWWRSSHWGLRSALCAIIGGLVAYSYLNLGLEGTKNWMEQSGTTFVLEVVVTGMLLGWIIALVWWMRTDGRYPKRKKP